MRQNKILSATSLLNLMKYLGRLIFLLFIPAGLGVYFFVSETENAKNHITQNSLNIPINISEDQNRSLSISKEKWLGFQASKDTILMFSFHLQEPIGDSPIYILSGQIDVAPVYPGFSLYLINKGHERRPVMYYRDKKGNGGRFDFTSINAKENEVITLALFSDKIKAISLHQIIIDSDLNIKKNIPLGGFSTTDISDEDLNIPLWLGVRITGKTIGAVSNYIYMNGDIGQSSLSKILKTIDLKQDANIIEGMNIIDRH